MREAWVAVGSETNQPTGQTFKLARTEINFRLHGRFTLPHWVFYLLRTLLA